MSTNDFHDDFMKLGDMSDIDNRILDEAGRDDLIDRMHEQKDKNAALKSPWMREVKDNWFLYALLAISLLLTETLAIYLGTAPTLMTNAAGEQYIHFHNDLGHLFTALVYMLVFPIVTELAFDNSRKKFNKRETGNWRQTWTMGLSIIVSMISWIGTGVAGAYVILSTLGSLGFMEIPKNVQTWLVWIVPVLLAFFALMNWLYEAGSRFAKSKKMAEEEAKNAELADQMRMQQIERAGKRAIRAAAIRSFEQAVALGLLSQAEADSALAQGMSLADLERKLNRDITGEGKIGDTSGLNRTAPKDRPGLWVPEEEYRKLSQKYPGVPGKFSPYNEDDIALAKSINPLAAPYRACQECEETVPLTAAFCPGCGAKMPPLPKPANKVNGNFH
jgi:hypothetical protein